MKSREHKLAEAKRMFELKQQKKKEKHRGRRLSERMIQSIISYAMEFGYEKVYIMSGEIGLYE